MKVRISEESEWTIFKKHRPPAYDHIFIELIISKKLSAKGKEGLLKELTKILNE